MDGFCYVVGLVLALCATVMVAFPDNFLPGMGARKKRVAARQWGQYHTSSKEIDGEEEEQSIEVRIPARKVREIAGSQTYAAGRGVRMG